VKSDSFYSFQFKEIGAPGEIRTPDPLLRRQTLYPSELRARCYDDSKSIIRDDDTILEVSAFY